MDNVLCAPATPPEKDYGSGEMRPSSAEMITSKGKIQYAILADHYRRIDGVSIRVRV